MIWRSRELGFSEEPLAQLARTLRNTRSGSILDACFPEVAPVTWQGKLYAVETQLWVEGWSAPITLRQTGSNIRLCFCLTSRESSGLPNHIACLDRPGAPTRLLSGNGESIVPRLCELFEFSATQTRWDALQQARYSLQHRILSEAGLELKQLIAESFGFDDIEIPFDRDGRTIFHNFTELGAERTDPSAEQPAARSKILEDIVAFIGFGERIKRRVLATGLTRAPYGWSRKQAEHFVKLCIETGRLAHNDDYVFVASDDTAQWTREAVASAARKLLGLGQSRFPADKIHFVVRLFSGSGTLNEPVAEAAKAWLGLVATLCAIEKISKPYTNLLHEQLSESLGKLDSLSEENDKSLTCDTNERAPTAWIVAELESAGKELAKSACAAAEHILLDSPFVPENVKADTRGYIRNLKKSRYPAEGNSLVDDLEPLMKYIAEYSDPKKSDEMDVVEVIQRSDLLKFLEFTTGRLSQLIREGRFPKACATIKNVQFFEIDKVNKDLKKLGKANVPDHYVKPLPRCKLIVSTVS